MNREILHLYCFISFDSPSSADAEKYVENSVPPERHGRRNRLSEPYMRRQRTSWHLIWIYSSKKLTNYFTFWNISPIPAEQELWCHSISQSCAGLGRLCLDGLRQYFARKFSENREAHQWHKLQSSSRHVAQSFHAAVSRTCSKLKLFWHLLINFLSYFAWFQIKFH